MGRILVKVKAHVYPMLPPHVAVIYDADTLVPLRVYVNEDHEDGAHIFTIEPGVGEVISRLPKSEVRGLDLEAIALKAKLSL